jgi:sortase A
MRNAALWLRRLLTAGGVLCLGTWTGVTVWAHVSAARNEALLEHEIRVARGCAVRPAGLRVAGFVPGHGEPAPGSLIGRIDVPEAGVSAIVLEGTSTSILAQAAGHVPGTALPGEDGNAVVAGHRDSLFRGLRDINVGDTVTVTTPLSTRRYEVTSLAVVTPDDLNVLAPTSEPTLTLLTCFPFTYVGPAPQRFVVRAVASDTGDPTSVVSVAALERTADQARARRRTHLARTRAHRRSAAPPARTVEAAEPPPPAPPPGKKLHWWQRLFRRATRPRAEIGRTQRAPGPNY